MRRHPPFLDIEMEIHTGNIPEGHAGTVAAVHIADAMRGYGFGKDTVFTVFAGNGGNGRDGIEAASVFSSKGFRCEVVRLEDAGAYLEAHSGRKAGHEEIYIDALVGADEYADFKGRRMPLPDTSTLPEPLSFHSAYRQACRPNLLTKQPLPMIWSGPT